METTRFILLVALGLVLTMIYQSWQQDYGVLSVQSNKKGQELALESTTRTSLGDVPTVSTSDLRNLNPALPTDRSFQRLKSGEIVHVKTDLLDLSLIHI